MVLNNVNFYTGQIIDDYIYASQSFYNGLISINLMTNKARFIGRFSAEENMVPVLHRFSYLYKRKIFFIPCDARGISIYDEEKGIISTIPMIDYCRSGNNKKCYFVNGNRLWLIPVSGDGSILIVNMDNNEVEVRDVKETPFYRETILNICQRGERIYFAGHGSDKVIEYDLKKEVTRDIKISVSNIALVAKCKEGICVINQEGKYVCYITQDNEKKYIINNYQKGEQYINLVEYDKGVYIIPYSLGAFLRKKIDEECFEKHDIRYLGIEKCNRFPGVFSYDLIDTDDMWYLPPYNTNKMLTIDKRTGIIEARELVFENPIEISELEIKEIFVKNIGYEGVPIDLKTFISMV